MNDNDKTQCPKRRLKPSSKWGITHIDYGPQEAFSQHKKETVIVKSPGMAEQLETDLLERCTEECSMKSLFTNTALNSLHSTLVLKVDFEGFNNQPSGVKGWGGKGVPQSLGSSGVPQVSRTMEKPTAILMEETSTSTLKHIKNLLSVK